MFDDGLTIGCLEARKIGNKVTVTCQRRHSGGTEGQFDFYYHMDGKGRLRSMVEVRPTPFRPLREKGRPLRARVRTCRPSRTLLGLPRARRRDGRPSGEETAFFQSHRVRVRRVRRRLRRARSARPLCNAFKTPPQTPA